MIDYDNLYCNVDDFCKGFEPWYKNQLVCDSGTKSRIRKSQLKLSEILTILLSYHESGMSCFKYYYLNLNQSGKDLFPGLVHYSRFCRLAKRSFPALVCMLKSMMGEASEYLFIDSTPVTVCHNLREKRHRTFKGLAAKGRTSTGFFFGFKLHMIFNTNGQIVRLVITKGNVDDRTPVRGMMKGIKAKLIGDKGYLSQSLFDDLFKNGSTLITKLKRNMKNKLMPLQDKLMLLKRSFVESIFSSIKACCSFVHHRHRSVLGGFSHIISGLISYQIRDDKPSLSFLFKLHS